MASPNGRDDRLGMELIADRDMKQAKKNLKRRSERMERADDSMQTSAPANSEQLPQG